MRGSEVSDTKNKFKQLKRAFSARPLTKKHVHARELSKKQKLRFVAVAIASGLIFYAVGVATFFQSPMFSMFWIVSSQTALTAIYAAVGIAAAVSATTVSMTLIKKRNTMFPKTTPEVASKRKLPKTTPVVVALVIIGLALSLTTYGAITTISPHTPSIDEVSKSPHLPSNSTSVPPNSPSASPNSANAPSSGTMAASANCGLYSNSACTFPMSSVNWGTLSAGETSNQTIYIKNISSGQLTLNMTTTDWSPESANGPITLTWNQEGTILLPGQSTAAILTLTVSASEVGITNFSFQIQITGTNS